MKKIMIAIAMLLALPAAQAQTTLAQWDFSSTSMTGINTGTLPTTVIDGVTYEGHQNYTVAHHWNRIENTSVNLNNDIYGDAYYYGMNWIPNYFDAAHLGNDNGYMLISTFPQVPYSYEPTTNAYIAFPAISTVGASVVDVEWDQVYRKYLDNCYVDYSTDGDTWHTMEVNIADIDVDINSMSSIHVSYTLPLAAANQSTLYLRLRAYTNTGSDPRHFGCFWAVDNFTVKSGATSRWRLHGEEYRAGVYGMVPQGFILPPVRWQGMVTNNGAVSQNNVAVNFVHTWATGADTAFSQAQGNLASAPDHIDTVVYNGSVSLPNGVAGIHTLRPAISSDALDTSYSTCGYVVSTAGSDGLYPWGLDHGVLTALEAGREEEMMLVRLSTGSQVTVGADGQPWQLRGVEMVAKVNSDAVGAVVEPVLYSTTDNADSFFMVSHLIEEDRLSEMVLGTASHTVTASETNSLASGYLMGDAVNTIRIIFGEPVTLEPNTNYYIGYRLVEGDGFAVASAVTSYPDAEGNMVRFANDPTLAPLANILESSRSQVLIRVSDELLANTSARPMIHALVGPTANIPTHTVSIVCDGNSRVTEQGYLRCDTTLTVHQGSTHTYHISGQGYNELAQVLVDGVPQENLPTFTYEEPLFNADGEQYNFIPHVGRILTFAGVASDHTIEVVSNPAPVHTVNVISDSGICLINAVAGDNLCIGDSMTVIFTLNCWTGGSWEYYYDSVFLLDGILVDGSPVEHQWHEGTNNYYITFALDGTDHTVQFLTHKIQWHTISIITNKDVLWFGDQPMGDTTMTSLEYYYFWIEFDSYSSTEEAIQNGETNPNCWLRHLYIDGEDYAGRECEYLSRNGNHYMLEMYYTADHTVELVFDNPDPYFGQPVENLQVTRECNHVTLTWSPVPSYQLYIVSIQAIDSATHISYGMVGDYVTYSCSAEFDLPVCYYDNDSELDPLFNYLIHVYYSYQDGNNTYYTSSPTDTILFLGDMEIHTITVNKIESPEFAGDIDLMEWWNQNIVNASELGPDSNYVHHNYSLVATFETDFSCNSLRRDEVNTNAMEYYDFESGQILSYSSVLKQVYMDGVPLRVDTLSVEGDVVSFALNIPYDADHEVIMFYVPDENFGIDEVERFDGNIYCVNGQIVVEGAGGRDVTLYDIMGRRLEQRHGTDGSLRFSVPSSGVYMIKVGAFPARKIVAVKQ